MPSEELLRKYADVALVVGLGADRGDRILIDAPVQTAEFTRLLVEQAYSLGARNVDVLWRVDDVSRARFSHGSAEAAEVITSAAEFRMRAYEVGDSILRVYAQDPMALAGMDVSRVKTSQKINGDFLRPLSDAQGAMHVPWTFIGVPNPAWTKTVFPGRDIDEATEALWAAILRACRIDEADPIHAYQTHLATLESHRDYLTSRDYKNLRYEGPGTDLRMELPEGALWMGGGAMTPEGRRFGPNIPTEEVFCTPHRMHAEGRIQATKPLSLFGTLVEGFAFEVQAGLVTSATAEKGQEALDQLLQTDPGAARFGEAAMVPQSGAVAAEELIWNNMLFDENDACHIALGQGYSSCLQGSETMSSDELLKAGINESSLHIDFVVGSSELDIYGVTEDGREEPIISRGEWGFDL